MIEVAHLHRRYGSVVAVDDLSFHLDKGEVVGFLGPNGAGKTTTMRILAGYLPATRAERVEVAGFDVMRQSIQVRGQIGYLPESVPLYREMRVQEMLEFHGRLHGMGRSELKSAVPAVLERVGVLDRRRQLVGHLSRGLKQRVGLAVALLPSPSVLILDEPTSGLDPLQRREVRNLIGELAREHTVLLSSHILAEIEMICPRVIILDRGRLLADGLQHDLVNVLHRERVWKLEAAVGDGEAAARLLGSLPGVRSVNAGAREGIFQPFELRSEVEIGEDVGALALTKGWAIRRLSEERPTLEELFSALVQGELAAPGRVEPGAVAEDEPASDSAGAGSPLISLGMGSIPMAPAAPVLPPGTPPPTGRTIYSLNPFDRGASRDLSKPVSSEPDGEQEAGQ
ncbi:MAG: ABC transporter ATP-binding protein [Planctomycetota bacterium]